MKSGKFVLMIVAIASAGLIVATAWMMRPVDRDGPRQIEADPVSVIGKANREEGLNTQAPDASGCGGMDFGKFQGEVVRDDAHDYYFLQLRGARFPFKASPLEAGDVPLIAAGKTDREKNTALIYAMLGGQVRYMTLLINPDEEKDAMPAVEDIVRYVQIVNPRKLAGLAYTKEGGKLKNALLQGSPIQSLHNATPATPLVSVKGPDGGAEETRVAVLDGGRIVVEGKSYPDLYKAAARVGVTLLKMLCGSSDCPDAAACASGGSCGC